MSIALGKKAPAFELPSSEGGTISLRDLAGRYAVIFFYPKDNTPGCTLEAQGFRDAKERIEALGARVLGVSKDSLASHAKFREKHGLNFPLLSDPEGTMIEAYGAWGEKVLYGKRSMGIIRSTVILDPKGKVVAHFPKVKVKGHVDEVIARLEELAAG
ncbi:MAG: peroxiredoxin [Myxococcales bacterium]|jgi:peroxiredoxin Q/BCP|nr:peroxiredoxin [Myxococcales bacterium]